MIGVVKEKLRSAAIYALTRIANRTTAISDLEYVDHKGQYVCVEFNGLGYCDMYVSFGGANVDKAAASKIGELLLAYANSEDA